ncbi:hypothetical protein [Dokdonia sp. Hel_I_53]|uniref:hypothetical protein n=1 Tax=Dokdonia sp. Hel_I_53 TaxID=1566287 RepID=UPI00119C1AB4|nr:hypothetical protein [Dokdonia sp. Hel_I_53]TVZ51557.1 hypothetical protein OD90_0703 [Dokdonia sp. Hel_I_53]
MVDELELLKKDWKKQEGSLPKFSREDIYPMLLKKSSSIIKWILIISIIEFAFWIILNLVLEQKDSNAAFEKKVGIETVDTVLLAINYAALIYFIIRFYLNYKAIQSTDNAKVLMKTILKARNTVKQYIWFNVSFIFVGSIVVFLIAYYNDPTTFDITSPIMLVLTLLIVMGILIGILLLVYRLIYGRLTRRLKSNYEQLKKLEV